LDAKKIVHVNLEKSSTMTNA